MVLPTALVFLGVLALLAMTAFVTTTTEMKIGGNYKIGEQAFYEAQAGCEEARARLRANAAHPILDAQPTQGQWRAYIGTLAKAKEQGYDPGNALHLRYDHLASDFAYGVQITHQTDAAGHILYWGDANGDAVNERNTLTGENIYLVSSHGSRGGSSKTIGVEVARIPTITVPSALYVEKATTVQGGGTYIIGADSCGSGDKAGIVTTQGPGSVTINGSPHLTGLGGTEPNVVYNGTDMDIQGLTDGFKELADFSYTVSSAIHSPGSTPGPGDGWGTPISGATPQDPSSCSGGHIVYYNTQGTYVILSAGVSGCGMLFVEGDLEIQGDFSWYGPVIVTRSVLFTGGGAKHVTGALIVGGSAVLDVMGASANIVYCSAAIDEQTNNRPLQLLSWREDM
jgi:Tfp pilus assembly protein PilX